MKKKPGNFQEMGHPFLKKKALIRKIREARRRKELKVVLYIRMNFNIF